MRFSLRIICSSSAAEIIAPKAKEMLRDFHLSDDITFSPYWKDDQCMILELHTEIAHPDYRKIRQHVLAISGADALSESDSPDDWECACFAPPTELHSGQNKAFVVCNIF